MPIVELAVAVSGKAAEGVIGPLLRDLLEVQDQHTQALEALQSDLRKLVEGPRRRARTALEDATLAEGARRQELLTTVLEALREAHSYEPAPSAARAAAAAEIAVVASMLGFPDEGQRWARRSHDDARAAITAEIPALTRVLNKRGSMAARARDSLRNSPEQRYIFWKLITEYDKYNKDVVDRRLWRQAFSRTFTDGIELTGDLDDRTDDLVTLGLPEGNKKAEFAVLLADITQRNVQGARLMRLHRLAGDAEDYRQVRAKLCGDGSLPVEFLRVDVSVPYQARLEWAAG